MADEATDGVIDEIEVATEGVVDEAWGVLTADAEVVVDTDGRIVGITITLTMHKNPCQERRALVVRPSLPVLLEYRYPP